MKTFCQLILGLSLLLSACSVNVPLTSPNLSSHAPAQASSPEALEQIKIRNKPPYQKPLQVGINTALLSQSNEGKALDLSASLTRPDTEKFRVQSQASTDAVFEQTWTVDEKNWNQQIEFELENTSQRYSLWLEKSSWSSQVELNINGVQWIKISDWQGRRSLQKKSLLLNAKNRLHIRVRGRRGVNLKLRIVPGGESATLLRRQPALNDNTTQQMRERQNEVNIFHPNQSNSLGDLRPYSQRSVETGLPDSVTGMRIDDGAVLLFEANTLMLPLAQP